MRRRWTLATTSKDQNLIVAIARALIKGIRVLQKVRALLSRLKAPEDVVREVSLIAIRPMLKPSSRGDASVLTYRDEWLYRAYYVVNATRRLTEAIKSGGIEKALAQEEAHYRAHVEAQASRLAAAGAVDAASERFGSVVGWYAVLDSRTTPGCKANHGKNFDVRRPPSEGLPGTLHGGSCRCSPGSPHTNGRML